MTPDPGWRDRIRIHPEICHGKPRVKGTRIPVSLILGLLASGESVETILEEYPHLAREDVLASLAYAAEIVRTGRIGIPVETG